MPLELAESREKSAIANPVWHESEMKRLEKMSDKYKISMETIGNVIPRYTTIFKRSGLSYSKRLHSLVVANNAVRHKDFDAIKATQNQIKKPTEKYKKSKGLRPTKSVAFTEATNSRNDLFLTTDSPVPKNYNETQLLDQLRPNTVKNGRMVIYMPSESTQSTRAIAKMLHPKIPEFYLNLP